MSGAVNDKRYLIDNFYCQIDQLDIENIAKDSKAIVPSTGAPATEQYDVEESKEVYSP